MDIIIFSGCHLSAVLIGCPVIIRLLLGSSQREVGIGRQHLGHADNGSRVLKYKGWILAAGIGNGNGTLASHLSHIQLIVLGDDAVGKLCLILYGSRISCLHINAVLIIQRIFHRCFLANGNLRSQNFDADRLPYMGGKIPGHFSI